MIATWPILLIVGTWLFAIGSVVGSFANVCIYRIPWEKSLIWPGSRCPKCLHAIAPRDNLPIIGWLVLGGKCRSCATRIAVRYPLIELLTGLLFVAVFLTDVVAAPRTSWGEIPVDRLAVGLYHALLVALLVVATFIDYDLYLIPDQITITGMIVGVGLGAWFPGIRPTPSNALTPWNGLLVGITGLLVGGGLTQFVRLSGSLALRKEAMGFGDVTLMSMIGAFLGWQAAVLCFFLAPFFGIAHALWKLALFAGKWLRGAPRSSSDREIPFGPYLSMAAVALILSWRWLWPLWARPYFDTLRMVFWWVLGQER